jgi:hypothetical protein
MGWAAQCAAHAVRNRAGMPGHSQAIDAKQLYSQQFRASEVADRSIATYRRATSERRQRSRVKFQSRAPAAGLLAATPISRIWAPYQRLLHTFEQLRFIERLAQKTDCSGLHRSVSSPVLWKGSNENDRRAVAVSNQVVLQLHTVHTGHLHIRNDAGRFAQSGRGQEFFRRSKRVYRKSHQPQQPGCRGTHRSIVVDDRDYRDLCHAT